MTMSNCDVIVVDDNENDVELALRAFKKNGLTQNIMVFINGDDVIDYLFARGKFSDRKIQDIPKLILLDIKMPLANGFEVLRIIKTNPVTKIIPVVMLTSSNQEKDIAQCYTLGANSFIVKTVDYHEFSEQIHHIGLYWLTQNMLPKL